MRALVTGASGFIGRHLVRRLIGNGVEVHALLRPTSDASCLPAPCVVHVCKSDDPAGMAAVVSRSLPDITFHLAACVSAEHGPDDIVPMLQANLIMGTMLVESLTSQGCVRLVNTGTPWQHFENRAYDPVSLYAATKEAFQNLLEYYVQARKLQVVTLMPADNYGPDDQRGKLVGLLLRTLRSGGSLALSPGAQALDILHVDDVVEAYVTAADRLLESKSIGAERWAVTSGRSIGLRDLVALVERLAGQPLDIRWGARPYREREVMSPCIHEAPLPGWTPRRDLETGLRLLLEHSRSVGAREDG